MGHHSNHFQVNGQSIKQFRAALGWSQAALADRAGYSERLVRKAEAGGKISLQALRDLAEALSSESQFVHPDYLRSDNLSIAKQVLLCYDIHRVQMIGHCHHLLSSEIAVHFHTQSPHIPFAGSWQGISGFQAFLNLYCSLLTHHSQSIRPTFTTGEETVSARYHEQFHCGESKSSSLWFNQHFRMLAGRVVQIDYECDTDSLQRLLSPA